MNEVKNIVVPNSDSNLRAVTLYDHRYTIADLKKAIKKLSFKRIRLTPIIAWNVGRSDCGMSERYETVPILFDEDHQSANLIEVIVYDRDTKYWSSGDVSDVGTATLMSYIRMIYNTLLAKETARVKKEKQEEKLIDAEIKATKKITKAEVKRVKSESKAKKKAAKKAAKQSTLLAVTTEDDSGSKLDMLDLQPEIAEVDKAVEDTKVDAGSEVVEKDVAVMEETKTPE